MRSYDTNQFYESDVKSVPPSIIIPSIDPSPSTIILFDDAFFEFTHRAAVESAAEEMRNGTISPMAASNRRHHPQPPPTSSPIDRPRSRSRSRNVSRSQSRASIHEEEDVADGIQSAVSSSPSRVTSPLHSRSPLQENRRDRLSQSPVTMRPILLSDTPINSTSTPRSRRRRSIPSLDRIESQRSRRVDPLTLGSTGLHSSEYDQNMSVSVNPIRLKLFNRRSFESNRPVNHSSLSSQSTRFNRRTIGTLTREEFFPTPTTSAMRLIPTTTQSNDSIRPGSQSARLPYKDSEDELSHGNGDGSLTDREPTLSSSLIPPSSLTSTTRRLRMSLSPIQSMRPLTDRIGSSSSRRSSLANRQLRESFSNSRVPEFIKRTLHQRQEKHS